MALAGSGQAGNRKEPAACSYNQRNAQLEQRKEQPPTLRGTLQTPNEKPRNLNPNQLTLPLSFAYLHIHLPHTRGVQCGDRLGRSSVAWRNHQTDACAAMAAATKTTATAATTATHTIESFAQRCVYVIYYKRRHFASFRVGKFVRVCVSV